jgi:ABC-type Zn2+ transport system substrate-binding protein/surface adhesin
MLVPRSRLRLPASLAALLLLLVGAGDGVGFHLCMHEAAGHGAHQDHGQDHGHEQDHGHGLAHGHDHDQDHPDPAGSASGAENHDGSDRSDPCAALCLFLCAITAGSHLPESTPGTTPEASPLRGHVALSPGNAAAVPRPTALPHFLPFAQAPPVSG